MKRSMLVCWACSSCAYARDDRHLYSLTSALTSLKGYMLNEESVIEIGRRWVKKPCSTGESLMRIKR